jgi:hypothetical protein
MLARSAIWKKNGGNATTFQDSRHGSAQRSDRNRDMVRLDDGPIRRPAMASDARYPSRPLCLERGVDPSRRSNLSPHFERPRPIESGVDGTGRAHRKRIDLKDGWKFIQIWIFVGFGRATDIVNAICRATAQTRHRPTSDSDGAPGWDRTSDPWLRRPILYPLSYGRTSKEGAGSEWTQRPLRDRKLTCFGEGSPPRGAHKKVPSRVAVAGLCGSRRQIL